MEFTKVIHRALFALRIAGFLVLGCCVVIAAVLGAISNWFKKLKRDAEQVGFRKANPIS